ncbi:complement C1q-like protein 2 [Esox lucius]|uniref:C1q domain-containing protein n=1 Tax=Esox lucius TaxID=8010 RepID=A0A3P8XK24_ESOLU|nr:complement C1q-like protein 2 [Esox lucius]
MGDCNCICEIKALRSMVEDLKKTIGKRTMVAFSASLRPEGPLIGDGYGKTGPFNHLANVIFQEAITNIGDAYDKKTGVFTAPEKGVYYMTFTIYGWANAETVGAGLYKNGTEMCLAWLGVKKVSTEDFATHAVVLQLEKGDTVNVRLPQGMQITSREGSNVTTFSGFLLNSV